MNREIRNKVFDIGFRIFGIFSTFLGVILIAIFISSIVQAGFSKIDWNFLTGLPSRFADHAGILTAWTGSLWILALSAIIGIPVGVGAAIFFEEYAPKNSLTRILEINLTNLAGVPSVIYGILGLELFVRSFKMGSSLLAGACTLSLLILPIVIVATREALRAVPQSIRQASFSMGATKWQTIWHQILPASAGGIATGVILALSRAVGEAAPVIVIGALAYVPFVAESPLDDFTVLPIQIFNWVTRPDPEFIVNASAGIIVLLSITFLLNGIAVYLRYRWQKKMKW
ncbi:MAG: phosphate ABC transporter permease PstA [Saprospiraceae bacterium]|nr:phosphate ABC transporter permease PstA [Saprospiraceae bacterium]